MKIHRTNVAIQVMVDLFARTNLEELPDQDPRKVLLSRDPYTLVVRAHPIIEQRLRAALDFCFYDYRCAKKLRLQFFQLIRLCAALGLYDPKYLPAFLEYNKMRNLLAHNAGASLPQERVKAFAKMAQRDVGDVYTRVCELMVPDDPDAEGERFRTAVVALHIIALEAHARCSDNLERRRAPPNHLRYCSAADTGDE